MKTRTFFLLSFLSLIFTFFLPIVIGAQEHQTDSIALQQEMHEVIVVGDSIVRYGDRDVVCITKYMRRGSYNTGEMLDKIPGVSYNRVTGDISYLGDKNICLLVDSLPKDASYIKNLGHLRFEKVEIIHNPRGKYADYDYIINLRTKNHYEGYENSLYLSLDMFPNNNNGRNRHFSKVEGAEAFTYTRDKWNFLISYSNVFGQGERNSFYSKSFLNNDYKESVIENADGSNNQYLIDRKHQIGTSVDYQIDKRNSVSVAYGLELMDNDNVFNRSFVKSDLAETRLQQYQQYSAYKDKGSRQGIGLYYRGGHKSWNYNLTFNYFHRDWDTGSYLNRSTGYRLNDNRHQYMDHTFTQADADRRFFSNKLYWSVSYIHFWRSYDQFLQESDNLLSRNTLMYHQVGSYVSYQLDKRTSFHLSAYFRNLRSESLIDKDKYMTISGSAGLYHNFGDIGWARINYNCNTYNPSLAQTTAYGSFTDSLRYHIGNPMLRTSISHKVQIRFNLARTLTLSAGTLYYPRCFLVILDQTEGPLQNGVWSSYITSQNQMGEYLRRWTNLNLNTNIGNMSIDGNVYYYHNKASYQEFCHSIGYWGGNLQITYMFPQQKFYMALNYNSSSPSNVNAQSTTTGRNETITTSIMKTFNNDRLRLALQYTLPFGFSSSKWSQVYESPGYENTIYQNTEKQSRNYITFSLSYLLSGGKSVRQYKREMSGER